MRKRLYLYLIFVFILNLQAQRQAVLKTNEQVLEYNKIPQERVFVHYNTSLFFAGEYLYYKIYCKSSKNNLLSDLSKIAYVELIDEKKQVIFRHKIRLQNGSGQDDFFIPVSIASGNYKLLGYTQWMLNSEKANFFLGDISVINPYQSDQKAILKDPDSTNVLSQLEMTSNEVSSNNIKKKDDTGIKILIENNFDKRSLVKLVVDRSKSIFKDGDYSISVRKKDDFFTSELISSKSFDSGSPRVKIKKKALKDAVFLPEIRGEMIYGRLKSTDDSAIKNQKIGISISNIKNNVDVVSTDENGFFVFTLDEKNEENSVILQALKDEKNDRFNYTIDIIDFPDIVYPDMKFYDFEITSKSEKKIIQRSIYNQIENNFFNVKPDTIRELKHKKPFYGKADRVFDLDDYTRFPTVKETAIEIIEGLKTKKNKSGERVFSIQDFYPTQSNYNFVPLVIVDDVIVQEHEDVMNYDARKVKNISYVRDRYFLGTKIYQGILIIKTINGDFLEKEAKSYYKIANLKGTQKDKNYFTQKYDSPQTSYDRIPDYRRQLFWKPDLKLINDVIELEFFTSDVTGDFEISLEGFSNNGSPISIKEYFTVN